TRVSLLGFEHAMESTMRIWNFFLYLFLYLCDPVLSHHLYFHSIFCVFFYSLPLPHYNITTSTLGSSRSLTHTHKHTDERASERDRQRQREREKEREREREIERGRERGRERETAS